MQKDAAQMWLRALVAELFSEERMNSRGNARAARDQTPA